MEPVCDFCGVVRALVYCKSDMAKLCLQCDGCVHSANALSKRHPRSLLCDKCNTQPAIAWCMDDKMSLCHACDWNNGNGGGCSSLGHRCQILNPYTGCPYLAEFSRIWPSVLLDANAGGNNCSSNSVSTTSLGQISSLSLNENCGSNCLEPRDNEGSIGLVTSKLNNDLEPWMGNSPAIPPSQRDNYVPSCSSDPAPPFFSEESKDPKATSSGQQDYMAFQSSRVVGGTVNVMQPAINCGGPSSMLMNPSCNRNINLGFPPAGQVNSSMSISLSNITGESSAADYQDCGLSPVFLPGEAPWESSLEASSPQARDKAKMRYHEKKKTRTFGKQIRYASRKARADTRKRVKGRFVKAGEAYDYDPLGNRNF